MSTAETVFPGREVKRRIISSLCVRSIGTHVYGEVDKDLETACRELHLPLHVFAFSDHAKDAGLKQDALYVVRPDGYIALASFEQSASKLRTFVRQFHLCFKNSSMI
jgi:hypothetical protein